MNTFMKRAPRRRRSDRPWARPDAADPPVLGLGACD